MPAPVPGLSPFARMDHYDDKAKQDALVDGSSVDSTLEDDRILQEIGYVPSFKREFSNLATVRPLFPPEMFSLTGLTDRSALRSVSWASAQV